MHETNWKGLIPMPESLIFFHEERERESLWWIWKKDGWRLCIIEDFLVLLFRFIPLIDVDVELT